MIFILKQIFYLKTPTTRHWKWDEPSPLERRDTLVPKQYYMYKFNQSKRDWKIFLPCRST